MEVSLDTVDTLNAIDACVAGVDATYKLFMTSIIGEFHRCSSSNVNKQTVRYFRQSCKLIQASALSSINATLCDGLRNIEASLPSMIVKDFALTKTDLEKKLKGAYQAQMLLDIEACRSDLFRYALAVTSRIDLGDRQSSAMIAADKSVRFNFIDRAGKKWNSSRYIFTITRFEIIKAIYFSFMLDAISNGETKLTLSNGSLIDFSEMEKYSHPNSKLIPIQSVIN